MNSKDVPTADKVNGIARSFDNPNNGNVEAVSNPNNEAATNDMKSILKMLAENHKSFLPQDCYTAVMHVMYGASTHAQTAAFLAFLRAFELDRVSDYVAAAARAMSDASTVIHTPVRDVAIDIVGTGGDGKDTFNVSTASSIVAAACGCTVAKHGNRASSSAAGSADVLEKLGCLLSAVDAETVISCLHEEDVRFCFLFAPNFHPAMKHAAVSRKEIGFRTIFNLIGPLCNPVQPAKCIVGVARKELGDMMARALLLSGTKCGWVVCGDIGLDEISPEGTTTVWAFGSHVAIPANVETVKLTDGITRFSLDPLRDFGVEPCSLDEVSGGTVAQNASAMEQLLRGDLVRGATSRDPHDEHPLVRFAVLNAAATLFVAGERTTLRDATTAVRDVLASDAAWQTLGRFRAATTAAAARTAV